MEICPKCGIPKEACICETLAKSAQKINVEKVSKKYGKWVTQVSGMDNKSINLRDIAKQLKSELACGGTIKNNVIELQGDHVKKVKEKLIEMGFQAD
jgi:translation initiation factor 1